MIERIEVIRGPAAARYGNGAAGGVVNIITKKDDEWHGSWNTYMNAPEHKDEGSTKRTNFSLSGPLGGDFSFRLLGNLDKTQADAWDINQGISQNVPVLRRYLPAGREGVKIRTSTAWCAGISPRCSRWSLRPATAARATSTRATRRTPIPTTW
jgi:ferric enterobactin receptor